MQINTVGTKGLKVPDAKEEILLIVEGNTIVETVIKEIAIKKMDLEKINVSF
jgi:hypothetical protein